MGHLRGKTALTVNPILLLVFVCLLLFSMGGGLLQDIKGGLLTPPSTLVATSFCLALSGWLFYFLRNHPMRFLKPLGHSPIQMSASPLGLPHQSPRPAEPSPPLPYKGSMGSWADPPSEGAKERPITPPPRHGNPGEPLEEASPGESSSSWGPGGFRGRPETVEIHNLQEIQDSFSSLSGLSLLTYDSDGSTLCRPSSENPICTLVQKSPQGARHCRSHCGRSVTVALESREPVFFKCDAGLHVFTIPIIPNPDNPKMNMALLGGKVYYDRVEFEDALNQSGKLGVVSKDLAQLAHPLRLKDQKSVVSSVRLLESFFPHLASALREKNSMATQSTRMMSLFNLFSQLMDERSFNQHAVTILNTLGILFDLRTASVMILDPREKRYTTEAVFGQRKELVSNCAVESVVGLLGDLQDKAGPVSSDDTLNILRMGLPAEISSIHLFPLMSKQGVILSVLAVFDSPLTQEDIGIISAFCRQVGIFQEIKELRSERRELNQDMSVLLEIAKTVGSALESEDLFGIILEKSAGFLEAEQGSLLLLDEDRMELRVKAMKGLNKKIVELLRIQPGEGIAGKVFSTGTPLLVRDIEFDSRVTQERRPRYKTKSFISVPLRLNGRIFGVMNVADKVSGGTFSEEDLHILLSISTYASLAIERSHFYHKTQELKKISITDSLTGLLNRRYFQERISEEIERSRRHHLPLSLIMIDVDNFKKINDTYGHTIGDEVLKITGRCLRNCIRTIDVAARYGGEEFTVILPQTGKEDASVIAHRICHEISRMDFPFELTEKTGPLTVSLGLATYPDDAEGLQDLIRNSDVALYQAKNQGKNRVIHYDKSRASS